MKRDTADGRWGDRIDELGRAEIARVRGVSVAVVTYVDGTKARERSRKKENVTVGSLGLKSGLKCIWERLPRYLEVVVLTVLASGVSGYVAYTLTSQDVQPDITRVLGISVESFEQYPPEWRSLIALAAATPSKFSNKAQRVIREATPDQANIITTLAAFVVSHQLLFRGQEGLTNQPFPGVFAYQLMELESLGLVSGAGRGVGFDLASLFKDESSMGLDVQHLMIIVKHTDRASRGSFSVTKLTEVGQEIFDSLRVPVDMDHVSWVLELLDSKGWETELWGKWEQTGSVAPETQRWSFKKRYKIDHRRTSSQSAVRRATTGN